MEIGKFNYKIPIVWLDTNVIIDIARARKNAIQKQEIKERALKIYDTIYQLTRKRKILCVEGEQRDEYGNRLFLTKECDDLLTSLTLGLKLQHPLVTKQFQIQQMMKVYLGKQKKFKLTEAQIFHGDPINDLDRVESLGLIISVRWPIGGKQRDENIKSRDSISQRFEEIRATNVKNRKTFQRQLEDEYNANIKIILDYINKMIIKKLKGIPISTDELFQNLGILEPLHWWQYETGKMADLEGLKKFYLSEEFRNIPYIEISSKMYAKLLTDPNRAIKNSDQMDVEQMSILLPYCNYILTDAELKNRIEQFHFEKKYNVKVFSLRNVDILINELNGL